MTKLREDAKETKDTSQFSPEHLKKNQKQHPNSNLPKKTKHAINKYTTKKASTNPLPPLTSVQQ